MRDSRARLVHTYLVYEDVWAGKMSSGITVNAYNISSFDATVAVVEDAVVKNLHRIYLADVAAMATYSSDVKLRVWVTHPVHGTYTPANDYFDIARNSGPQSFYIGAVAGSENFLIGTVLLRDQNANLDIGLKLQFSAGSATYDDVPPNVMDTYSIEYPAGSGLGKLLKLFQKNDEGVQAIQNPDLFFSYDYVTKHGTTPDNITIGDFSMTALQQQVMDGDIDFGLFVMGDDGKSMTVSLTVDKPEPFDILTLDFYGSPDDTGRPISKEINAIRGVVAVAYMKLPWDVNAGIGIHSYIGEDGGAISPPGLTFTYRNVIYTIEPYQGDGLNALLTIDCINADVTNVNIKSILVYPKVS